VSRTNATLQYLSENDGKRQLSGMGYSSFAFLILILVPRFIYASEETGWRHLYLASVKASDPSHADDCPSNKTSALDAEVGDEMGDDSAGSDVNMRGNVPQDDYHASCSHFRPSAALPSGGTANCRKRKVFDCRSLPPRRSCSCRVQQSAASGGGSMCGAHRVVGGEECDGGDALFEQDEMMLPAVWRGTGRMLRLPLTGGAWEVAESK
jgi:hypothetical protein